MARTLKAADRRHLERVAELPCAMCGVEPCGVAHHPLGAGMGLKAAHADAIPICHEHHDDLHRARGAFGNMDKQARREWEASASQATRAQLGEQ